MVGTPTSRFIAALIAALTWVAPGATQAQDDAPFVLPGSGQQADAPFVAPTSTCAEGRVAVDMGYCCWPGQHASEDGRCLGPPRCPPGLVAEGADCVGSMASASSSTMRSDGSFRAERTDAPVGNRIDGGLLGGGITLILVGWLGTGITDTIGGGQTSYTGSGFGGYRAALPLWPFGWLPILHPLAVIDSSGSWGGLAAVVGTIGAALEISGLIMAVLGAIGHPVPAPRGWGARLGAAGADGGLTLELAL